jgi:hypothetical protein
MSPLRTEAERTPHAQCRDACTEAHRWFNTGDGVGGLKYWCKGPVTAEPPDPWDRPAAPAIQQMTLAEYDRLRDDVRPAVIHDKAFTPEAFWFLFTSLGTLAQTSADPDGFAARVLERVALRAKDGIPMYEPQEEVL